MAEGKLGQRDARYPTAPRSQLQNAQKFLLLPGQKLIDDILPLVDEEIGCDFLCLPHPVAGGIDFSLKMEHLLVTWQGRALEQDEAIMGIGRSDVVG